MKKLFIVFAMFMALSVMPASAQSLSQKVIPSVSNCYFTPKLFSYDGNSSVVTISPDKKSANVYDTNLDLVRSFNLYPNTLSPVSGIQQELVNGQWVDKSSGYNSFSYEFIPIYFEDYDELCEGNNCNFTQTLFNNDEKFEYIVPYVDMSVEVVNSEQDYNNDGEPDHRTITRGAVTKFNILNEDGTVIASIDSGLKFEVDFIKMGGKIYAVTTTKDSSTNSTNYNFYAIDKGASSVKLVKKVQAASNRIFTLDGREHSEMQHGLNIINGQKVIVK